MDRRSFLRGLIAAPAIVTFGNLMPVRGVPLSGLMLHHRVLTAREVLERYGTLQVRWQAQWSASADFFMPLPPPQRFVRMIASPPYSE
jgi:hypothetical protein